MFKKYAVSFKIKKNGGKKGKKNLGGEEAPTDGNCRPFGGTERLKPMVLVKRTSGPIMKLYTHPPLPAPNNSKFTTAICQVILNLLGRRGGIACL